MAPREPEPCECSGCRTLPGAAVGNHGRSKDAARSGELEDERDRGMLTATVHHQQEWMGPGGDS